MNFKADSPEILGRLKDHLSEVTGGRFVLVAWNKDKTTTTCMVMQDEQGDAFNAACSALLMAPMGNLIPEVIRAAGAASKITDIDDAQDVAAVTALSDRGRLELSSQEVDPDRISRGWAAAWGSRPSGRTFARMVAAAGCALHAAYLDLKSTRREA